MLFTLVQYRVRTRYYEPQKFYVCTTFRADLRTYLENLIPIVNACCSPITTLDGRARDQYLL